MNRNVKRRAALVIAIMMALTGCSGVTQVANAMSDAVGQFISGDVTGEVGKLYSTRWFQFQIESIETVPSYAGYEPQSGYELIDVVVTETSTFDEPIPMGTFDFFVDQEEFMDYIYPLDPLDDTMMPLEFHLEKGATVTYHMVYEVPEGYSDKKLVYVEVDEDDKTYATFTILIED